MNSKYILTFILIVNNVNAMKDNVVMEVLCTFLENARSITITGLTPQTTLNRLRNEVLNNLTAKELTSAKDLAFISRGKVKKNEDTTLQEITSIQDDNDYSKGKITLATTYYGPASKLRKPNASSIGAKHPMP